MDSDLPAYLTTVTERLRRVLDQDLRGLYLGGAEAWDDWTPTSDIDLIGLVEGALDAHKRDQLALVLSHSRLPCPRLGLDLMLIDAGDVDATARSPFCPFALATGAAWNDERSDGERYSGAWLDLAVVRSAGRVLFGSDAQTLIPEPPERWIREELDRMVAWHRTVLLHPFHDPVGANAVLNACRAWHLAETGCLSSKRGAAHWVLEQRPDAQVVQQALRLRQGEQVATLTKDSIIEWLDLVQGALSRDEGTV